VSAASVCPCCHAGVALACAARRHEPSAVEPKGHVGFHWLLQGVRSLEDALFQFFLNRQQPRLDAALFRNRPTTQVSEKNDGKGDQKVCDRAVALVMRRDPQRIEGGNKEKLGTAPPYSRGKQRRQ